MASEMATVLMKHGIQRVLWQLQKDWKKHFPKLETMHLCRLLTTNGLLLEKAITMVRMLRESILMTLRKAVCPQQEFLILFLHDWTKTKPTSMAVAN